MNILIYFLTIFSLYSCNEKQNGTNTGSNYTNNDGNNNTISTHTSVKDNTTRNIPEGLRRLVKAYPDFLDSASETSLYWKDGEVMPWDDGIEKTHDEKLNDPDLEDMMSQKYVKGAEWSSPPAENFEPGRIRYEPFFTKMYGSSSGEVQNHLATVKWLPSICGCSIQFNNVNGAADKMKNVSEEIEATLASEFHKYVSKTAGTFNWRNIAGTNRLSTHSFGTAIDINTKYSNYWQWDGNMTWKNQIPMEIVEIFEKHGFIWGGKWYHYDTMHFEYRPELLMD
jgi:peptidoglycan L-alanyl-D-glutamate endopeptidase CwlK